MKTVFYANGIERHGFYIKYKIDGDDLVDSFVSIILKIVRFIDSEAAKIFCETVKGEQNYAILTSEDKYEGVDKRSGALIRLYVKFLAVYLGIDLLSFLVSDFFYFLFIPVTVIMLAFTVGVIYYVGKYAKEYYLKAVKKFLKICLGIIGSFFITLVAGLIFPPLALIILGFTIYKNIKRKAFLDKFSRYSHFLIKITLITIVFNIVFAISEGMSNRATTESGLAVWNMLSDISLWMPNIILLYMIRAFYRNERSRGMDFDDCGKIMLLVPVTWFFMMFSVLSLIDHFSVTGEDFIADNGLNIDHYMNMPEGGENVEMACATDGPDVHVDAYTKQDGTYVHSHMRSNPDGIEANNWSHSGNVNPYTGETGQKK